MDLENKDLGFISIHRALKNKVWYSDSYYVHVWLHLLLSANHKDVFIDGVIIKRGQLKTGRKSLSESLGINGSKIERILDFFESENQIEQQKTNKFRIITLKNYDEWQKVNNKKQQENSNATAEEQQKTQTIRINNANNENNENKRDISKKEKINKKENLDYSILKIQSPELLEEFKKHRKQKGAKETERTLIMLNKEMETLEHNGISRDEAIKELLYRGWRALKADWILKDFQKQGGNTNGTSISEPKANDFKSRYNSLPERERAEFRKRYFAHLRASGYEQGYAGSSIA